MKIVFSEESWNDFNYWLDKDKKTVKRIKNLLKDREHRLVYKVQEGKIEILSCRYHY